VTYATDRIYEEVAYVAHHLHWRLEDILDLEHRDRRRFVAEAAAVSTRTEGR
jgi:hypothetical protein